MGLLACLAAHAALYGGGHAVGGSYHALLVQSAVAGVVSLILFFGALAWSGSRGITDGSVLAARLRERLPDFGALVVSTSLWYATAEATEPHHAGAAPALLVLTIAVVALLVSLVSRAVVDTLAGAAIAVLRTPFTPRTPSWARRPRSRPVFRRALRATRRFARPPPIAIACA